MFEQGDDAPGERPVRTFSPRSVPQLWRAMIDGTESEAQWAITLDATRSNKDAQPLLGPNGPEQAARAVIDWQRRVLHQGRLYHFSAALWAHALDCEADFPPWTPTRHDFPTTRGTVFLERPTMLYGVPVSALTYGPGAGWPGGREITLPGEYTGSGTKRLHMNVPGMDDDSWLITIWSTATDFERALGMGPIVALDTFDFLDWATERLPARAIAHRDGGGGGNTVPRAFKIAFDLATQANIATRRTEPVPRSLRKRAERAMPDAPIPTEVFVHDLRPRLAAAIGNRGGAGDPVHRADAHYRVNCWPVKPVLDPGTGDLLRRGYIAYRDPSLLEGDHPEPTEVWRGTDLDHPPGAPA